MNVNPTSAGFKPTARGGFGLALLTLAGVLSVMFLSSFDWDMALHSNDGPLGAQMNKSYELPGGYLGIWNNLYWLGTFAGSFFPNLTGALLLMGPHGYINFGAPISLFLLGLSAWLFFRTLGFGSLASVLGGLAMALNGNFFSHACWGLISRALCLAAVFLALAALQSADKGRTWLKVVLAGLAVGLSVTEGGDIGAQFSLYVAAFAFYRIVSQEGPRARQVSQGLGTVAVVATVAAVLAAQSLSIFGSLAVKSKDLVQEMQTKAERWDWATQWSLCKAETLRTIIPGLFGYRLDMPDGGNYWGRVGQTPGWAEHHDSPEWARTHPGASPRHSGAGEYTGVLVVLVALWALAHASWKVPGLYAPNEQRMIWFWGGVALISLLLSWGRFAPFYQLVYALPYFSTIRNPMKFMHEFHMAMVILFAYGLQGLTRRYLQTAATRTRAACEGVGQWLAKARVYERKWFYGCLAALALSVLAWLLTSSLQTELAKYISIEALGASPQSSPGEQAALLALAQQMARFSVKEIGLFAVFLALSVGLVALIQMGRLAGARAKWAGPSLGLLLIVDSYRADLPWVRYEYIPHKYATNPVMEVLRNNGKAYEYRVSAPAYRGLPGQAGTDQENFLGVYQTWWLQYNFQYYNIQALEVSQMPREIDYYFPFNRALAANPVRLWQLTNTRYLLGHAALAEAFNEQFDASQRRFRLRQLFGLTQLSPNNFSAQVTSNGPLGLIEFTGALPRAKLYSRWLVNTNDDATLQQLGSPEFDPAQTVLVTAPIPLTPGTNSPGAAGRVEIGRYSSRHIELKTTAQGPSVLLFNERYDPVWTVWVDGKPEPLLRCNYLMRGVLVRAGDHTVVFRYEPKANGFFLTLACVVAGLLLTASLVVAETRARHRSSA